MDKTTQSPKYWRSIEQKDNPEAFEEAAANEFKAGVTDDFDSKDMPGLSRKRFLALLGATAAFTTVGCENYRDMGEIIPYNQKPEEVTPGVATYYASTSTMGNQPVGILVKTREGRPLKVDGNPDDPVNQGKAPLLAHSSIYNLYDPERLKDPMKGSTKAKWESVDGEIVTALKSAKGVALIGRPNYSPSMQAVIDKFSSSYNAKFYAYETFNDSNRQSAWQKSHGGGQFPLLNWDKANVILSLEGDFLGNEGNVIEQSRMFSSKRNMMSKNEFNRLYVAEAVMSVTGANADYRLRVRPDQQFKFIMGVANEVVKKTGYDAGDLESVLSKYALNDFAKKLHLSSKAVKNLVNDLAENKGHALVYAGDKLPEAVHMAVNFLNEVLEAKDIYNSKQAAVLPQLNSYAELSGLVDDMNGGKVDVVINLDTNPIFDLPSDLKFKDALAKTTSVTMSETENETTKASKYSLPLNHDLESWGDFKVRSGLYYLQQPTISPLYNSRQKESMLLTWAGEKYADNLYNKFVMNRWRNEVHPKLNLLVDFRTFWNSALHNGMVEFKESIDFKVTDFDKEALAGVKAPAEVKDWVVVLNNNYSIGNGKSAQNGWLYELPHPITKVVWSNYASVSPKTARDNGFKQKHTTNDNIQVTVGGKTLTLPVYVQPGLADNVVAIELGFGREAAGTIGSGLDGKGVGFNGGVLLSKEGGLSNWVYSGSVAAAKGTTRVVSTAQHHIIDQYDDNISLLADYMKDIHKQRHIIHEGNYLEYKKNPKSVAFHSHQSEDAFKPREYNEVKWGMAIDTNRCTGCSFCVMACNVENNIPVVGPEQVETNREMTWMRIDRYYSGNSDDPEVSNQPMLCQHCDNAPCEIVCPVSATNHSPDGLNQMAYNRCVGTRYCSNNCPYKVRRFNFFDYRAEFPKRTYNHWDPDNTPHYKKDSHILVNNPEVTVRSRGVMEKCTFCVQRISEARQDATKEGRKFKGSDVTTACQEACPTDAIVFGDTNDPKSKISKYRKHVAAYHVLTDLNVRPNVTYMARLRNTHEAATHHGSSSHEKHESKENHKEKHHS